MHLSLLVSVENCECRGWIHHRENPLNTSVNSWNYCHSISIYLLGVDKILQGNKLIWTREQSLQRGTCTIKDNNNTDTSRLFSPNYSTISHEICTTSQHVPLCEYKILDKNMVVLTGIRSLEYKLHVAVTGLTLLRNLQGQSAKNTFSQFKISHTWKNTFL